MSKLTDKIAVGERWLITIAVMAATLMQVLDTTIVNVALPHMQGSLSAAPDEITWVLTSYLVASGIFMPLTGYFTDVFGRKKFLLVSIIGFTVASILCGAAMSIYEIVLFRLLQGVFGAGLVPLSQAILTDIFPEKERGTAMAIWGAGVMVGPILGPTLGGYLTDIASWRWTFYVNLPVGVFASLLVWRFVPDTVHKLRSMDWMGMGLIATAIASAQYVLDRGNQQDWLNGRDIRFFTIAFIISFIGFIFYSLRNKNRTVFDLKIFKDRNFTIASILQMMMGVGMYGAMVIQPQMLEGVMNYPVLTAGLVMAPRGIAGMVSMIFVGKLINYVDTRWLVMTGVVLGATGVAVTTNYSLQIDKFWLIWPIVLQGLGIGMIFVPLSAAAFSSLPASSRVEAAGLYSLIRTMGSSIGISITITFFTRHTQMAWNQVGGFVNPFNPALTRYLQSMHLQMGQPKAAVVLMNELNNQALMVSFVNTFAFIMWCFLIMLPLVLLLKKNIQKGEAPTSVIE